MRIQTWHIAIQQHSTGLYSWTLALSTYTPRGRQLPRLLAAEQDFPRSDLPRALDAVSDLILNAFSDGSVQPRLPIE